MSAKRKVSLFILFCLFSSILAPFVFAADFGILDSPALLPIKKALTGEVTVPISEKMGFQDSYPLSLVILVWIGLFAILWALIYQIEIFASDRNKSAATWLAFALSGIAVIGSPYVYYVTYLISIAGTWLFMVLLFGLFLLIIFGLGPFFINLRRTLGAQGEIMRSQAMQSEIKEKQEENKIKREFNVEQKLNTREDQAIKEAEKLLKKKISTITGGKAQIHHLILLVEQISQIKNEGESARLRQQFHSQASAVAAGVLTNPGLNTQLAALAGHLNELENGQIKVIHTLRSDLAAARTAAAGVPLTGRAASIEAWFTRQNTHLIAFENAQRRLVPAIQAILPTTGRTLVDDLKDGIDAVIRDVDTMNYPDAVRNLSALLNRFNQEATVIAQVGALLGQAQTAIDAINTQMGLDPAP